MSRQLLPYAAQHVFRYMLPLLLVSYQPLLRAAPVSLPDTPIIGLNDFKPLASAATAYDELKLGEAELRTLNQSGAVLFDPWLQETLLSVLNRINSQTALDAPIALLIIRDQNINAFAIPGGVIAINTGLIKQANNMDEIAGVLSHETAHLAQRHYSRAVAQSTSQTLVQIGGIIASVLLARKDPDSATALVVGSQAYVVDKQLAFSRDYEREADRIGMQLMQAAGFAPRGMATFFETLQKQTHEFGQVPFYLQTHPLTQDRLSEAYLRAAQLKRNEHITNHPLSLQQVTTEADIFHMMQLRLAALTKQVSINTLKTIAKTDDAAALALATCYTQAHEYEHARQVVQPIVTKKPLWVLAAITAAENEIAAHDPIAARTVLQPILAQQPESRALNMLMARIEILQQQTNSALARLSPFVTANPRDIEIWQLLLDAAEAATPSEEQQVNILRYRAEVDFWQADIDHAMTQLLRAKTLASSYVVQARIEHRLQEMRISQSAK